MSPSWLHRDNKMKVCAFPEEMTLPFAKNASGGEASEEQRLPVCRRSAAIRVVSATAISKSLGGRVWRPTTPSLLNQPHSPFVKPSLKRVTTFSWRPVIRVIWRTTLQELHRPTKARKRTLPLPGEF